MRDTNKNSDNEKASHIQKGKKMQRCQKERKRCRNVGIESKKEKNTKINEKKPLFLLRLFN